MSLSIAIVGLPNVGKSTLFNALTRAQNAEAANYPFCTIEPNKATVAVPDTRLGALARLVKPQKTIYATVDFTDVAGLVRGASRGEGLGNKFLANIRECSAIVQVVRCFDDANIVHVAGAVNPMDDIEVIETEMLLADLQTAENRLERLRRQAKAGKEAQLAADECEKLVKHLSDGRPASAFQGDPGPGAQAFAGPFREMGLLTAKKVIYCANVDENGLSGHNALAAQVRELAAKNQAGYVMICAKLEEELQGLPEHEQAEMLQSYGIEQSGLNQVIRSGYAALGLISFFTAGPKEVRAWTIKDGARAPQAAGVIHTDFEKGFIRAEIIAYDDYMRLGSESACRTAGLLRVEGKDYVMRDADVTHFLFNV